MKRGWLSSPVFKRGFWLLPGIVVAAIMLGTMIVHMNAAYAWLHSQPACSFYPETRPEQGTVIFPCTIQGTTLVAERIAAYDGPFVEDGSNDEVTGIAALVLRNCGERTVTDALVTLQREALTMTFYAQTIPPGGTVLVLERNRQPYASVQFSRCSGQARIEEAITLAPNDMRITVSKMNCITVTNTSDRRMTNVRIEHKGWLEEPGICVGGIVYVTQLGDLAPGITISVYADHFVDGYSRIVRVTCE